MKIAFIRPNWSYPVSLKERFIHNRIWTPLSLCYCAAICEKVGHDVSIIDAHALRLSPEETACRVTDCDRVFITSSTLDRWECPNIDIEPFVRTVRAVLPVNPRVCLMGVHGTVRPREILSITGADTLIMGEPESVVAQLAEGGDDSAVPGIFRKRGGEFLDGGRTPTVDINGLPLPAFHLVPMKKYGHVILGESCAVLEASRGCPFNCTVCLKTMYGPGYRKKRGEVLIEEVRYAVERFGMRSIVFIDLEFCLNREVVETLCDYLIAKRYDLRWACTTRFDSVDRQILEKMKAAGCVLVHYGVESASERILANLDKRMEISRMPQAVAETRAAGIESLCFFMFGIGDETPEEMQLTLDFALRLDPDYASFHVCNPLPTTKEYEKWKHEITELFPYTFPRQSRRHLEAFAKKAWMRFYLRPRKLLQVLTRAARHGIKRQLRLFLSYLR